MGNLQFNSKIELSYILDGEENEIMKECISSMILEHNFDNSTMPKILITLSIEYKLYDKILENVNKGLFRLTLKRYNRNSNTSLYQGDIHGLFTYLIPTNSEYNKGLIQSNDDNTSYKSGTIALLSLDNINENRTIYNAIIKNSNMVSVVHKYTSHMNMIIEPFRSNNYFETLIIPPISTLTRLLEYLNKEESFYDYNYRYFRDFDKTYLLSSAGNPVSDKGSEFDTVMINVLDPSDGINKTSGFDIDRAARAYILNIDASDTSMDIDIVTDLQCNMIVGFDDYNDMIHNVPLNTSIREDDHIRALIRREDDINTLKSIRSTMDSSSVVLNIIRSDINSSILTPNKEYIVTNYEDYKKYDGRFLLSYKKEIFIQQGDDFVSSVVFGLRKVME